jgi:hypothetical protein
MRFLQLSIPILLLAAACPDEQVSHEHLAKVAEPSPAPAPTLAAPAAPAAPQLPPGHPPLNQPEMPGTPPPGMAGNVPMPPRPTGEAQIAWIVPQGWTQTLTGGIRYATLKPPNGNVDVSVVVLGGPAGGEMANVNRWRGQIGLPPLTEGDLPKARQSLATKAGSVSLYDFTSEGTKKTRLVAGLLVDHDNTWFFKMTGDDEAVGKALSEFRQILASIHPAA